MSGVFTQSGVLVEGFEMTDRSELSFRRSARNLFNVKYGVL